MFPDILRTLRLSKGLKQNQLASAIYVSPSAISQYERGTIYPSRENLERLATFFNVSTAYLEGTSPTTDLEDLLNSNYHNDVTVNALIQKCLCISPSKRDALLVVIDSLSQENLDS